MKNVTPSIRPEVIFGSATRVTVRQFNLDQTTYGGIIIMPISNVGPFNQKNVMRLWKDLQQNTALGTEAVQKIQADFYGFMEQVFALTAKQKDDMRQMVPSSITKDVVQMLVRAFSTGGAVTYTPSPESGVYSLTVEQKCSYDSTTKKWKCSVTVEGGK